MIKDSDVKRELAYRELARRHYVWYAKYMMQLQDKELQWFHELICEYLDEWAFGSEFDKLMINMPPQHAKSTYATKMFPTWLLGRNPNARIAIASYSFDLARKFNRDIQGIMDTNEYANLFPNTNLNSKRVSNDSKRGVLRNSDIFEIVGNQGYVKTVGTGGALTGYSVDYGIIDDPFKDRSEAYSDRIRESRWDWYTDVFESRLHNTSKQLMILTRWHEDDIAGRALDRDSDWKKLILPAIKEKSIVSYDTRKENEVLWEDLHSLEKIEKIKRNSPITFQALYQQDPKPNKEALIYPHWGTYDNEQPYQVTYGLDFGFSNDVTALVEIKKRRQDVYVKELIYETGLGGVQLYNRMQRLGIPKNAIIICDTSEQMILEDFVSRYGYYNMQKTKKPQVIERIDFCQRYNVYIHSSSSNIIKERDRYSWVVVNGKATNVPSEGYDHAMDAIGYNLYTLHHERNTYKVI